MNIALTNSKGGVGKSTLAVHLVVWLLERGKRVARHALKGERGAEADCDHEHEDGPRGAQGEADEIHFLRRAERSKSERGRSDATTRGRLRGIGGGVEEKARTRGGVSTAQ